MDGQVSGAPCRAMCRPGIRCRAPHLHSPSNSPTHPGPGYTAASAVVRWFWDVVDGMDKEDLALLVQFVTGTSKVPLDGFAALQGVHGPQKFQIHKAYGDVERLPTGGGRGGGCRRAFAAGTVEQRRLTHPSPPPPPNSAHLLQPAGHPGVRDQGAAEGAADDGAARGLRGFWFRLMFRLSSLRVHPPCPKACASLANGTVGFTRSGLAVRLEVGGVAIHARSKRGWGQDTSQRTEGGGEVYDLAGTPAPNVGWKGGPEGGVAPRRAGRAGRGCVQVRVGIGRRCKYMWQTLSDLHAALLSWGGGGKERRCR